MRVVYSSLVAMIFTGCTVFDDAARAVVEACSRDEIVVTTTADGPGDSGCTEADCSLRAAIKLVKTCGSAQTIVLAEDEEYLVNYPMYPASDALRCLGCCSPGSCQPTRADIGTPDAFAICGPAPMAESLAALPIVNADVTIEGNGAVIRYSGEDFGGEFRRSRIFYVSPVGNLTLRNLTLAGGHARVITQRQRVETSVREPFIRDGEIAGFGDFVTCESTSSDRPFPAYGGAVWVTAESDPPGRSGGLQARDVTFVDNIAEDGGAVFAAGLARIDSSSFMDNRADRGGAIAGGPGGTVQVIATEFTGNEASLGGALYQNDATVLMDASTFAGNQAVTRSVGGASNTNSFGGAIYVSGVEASITLTSSTLTNNSAITVGGMVVLSGAEVSLTDVTIADNSSMARSGSVSQLRIDGGVAEARILNVIVQGASPNCGAVASVMTVHGLTNDPDGFCEGLTVGVPRLAGLEANGGPTRTRLPMDGSDAIDTGRDCLPTDQRRRPRPRPCDVGAVEVQPGG
jgi:CSLREA domain-containing protein